MNNKQIIFIIIYLIQFPENETAKILGFFTPPDKSNVMIHQSLMVRLAELGHNVTVVSSYEITKTHLKNYRHIHIPFTNDHFEKSAEKFMKISEGNGSYIEHRLTFYKMLLARHEEFLIHPQVKHLKNTDHFDLVVFGWFFNDFQIGIAAHFKCPSVLILTIPPSVFSRSYVGSPSGAAYNPSTFYGIKSPMNFKERVINFVFNIVEWVILKTLEIFVYNPIYRKHFPSDQYPSFEQTKLNISLVLVNHHFSLGSIEPAVPALVEVGGMQIKDIPSLISENIQNWLDTATDGVILFSLGSSIKSSNISPERRAIILRALSKLKQKIIWKYETDDLIDIPSNIMISKWLPQSDILAHPNTKLFISHCGLSSVAEAKFHGIPILGMPIYGDQYANSEQILEEGWGVQQLLNELTEELFSLRLNEVLYNSTYTYRIQKLSKLYRDRPEKPIDKAAYWVEYVLRHNGAKHMQSPGVHLNIIQYHSMDVVGFFVICLYILFKITKWTIFKLFKSEEKLKKD